MAYRLTAESLSILMNTRNTRKMHDLKLYKDEVRILQCLYPTSRLNGPQASGIMHDTFKGVREKEENDTSLKRYG